VTDSGDLSYLGPGPVPDPEGDGPSGERDFWRSRQWWRRLGETAAAGWIATGLAFVATVIAARALGVEDFGSVVLAMAVVTLVTTFLDVSLDEAVVHHGTRALVSGDVAGLRALLRLSMRLDIAVGIVACGAVVLLAAPLADVASAGRLDPALVRLAALGALVITANTTMQGVLLVAGRPELRSWATAATNVLRLVGVVVAVGLGGGPEAVLISYVVASLAGALVLAMIAWRVAWRSWTRGQDRGSPPVSASKLLRFAAHTSVTTSLVAVQASIIPIVLGRLSGPAQVGIFRVATLPVFAADTLSGPIRLVLFPEQARLAAQGRLGLLRRAMVTYTLAGFAVGAAGAVVGFFVLPWLIPLLYTSEFDEAVVPAQIMLIAAVSHFAFAWGKSFPAAVGRPGVRTAATAVMLALTVALMLVFGGEGAEGAAIAFTGATVLATIAWLVIVFRMLAQEEAAERSRAEQAGAITDRGTRTAGQGISR
jgi:O-antigen/teichoic acid export membrane protein